MFINTTGIVLREVTYKDSSKILTVLTSSEGKLTVSAHGTHRKNSKLQASTDLLVYSHMTLSLRKDRWTLTEAQTIEQFLGLRDDLKLLALGSYIAELTEAVADEDSPNRELLPLCLNTLYALSEKIKPPMLIKTAFELRLMAISGFKPLLREIGKSERTVDETVHLQDIGSEEGALRLSSESLEAAKYILTCNPKRLFSFELKGPCMKELAATVESYLIKHLDKTFRTLDYYKKVM